MIEEKFNFENKLNRFLWFKKVNFKKICIILFEMIWFIFVLKLFVELYIILLCIYVIVINEENLYFISVK